MKNLFILFGVLAGLVLFDTRPVAAQDFARQHEVSLSVGWLPSPTNFTKYDYNAFYHRGATYTGGAWTAAYGYSFKKWLQVGGSITYYGEFGSVHNNLDDSKVRNESCNLIFITPTVRFAWLNRNWVRLYSTVGISYGLAIEKYGNTYTSHGLSCQLTPIGIIVGKSLYGFAELGIGSQGIAKVGIGYRFNNKKHTKK